MNSPKPDPVHQVPAGWYAVCWSSELKPGAVLTRTLAGEELVLFRTASGKAQALSPWCPHLGAHLGKGGTVDGELLRCPMHGFKFDGTGTCRATGYGTKVPPRAKLPPLHVDEHGGVVMVWYHPMGEAHGWSVPPIQLEGWTPPRHGFYELSSHPQETSENSVDLGHFGLVHGFHEVEEVGTLTTDGPHLYNTYAVGHGIPLPGLRKRHFRIQFDIEVHGLGYSLVKVDVPGLEQKFRMYVLATPLRKNALRLHLGVSMKRRPKWWHYTRLLEPFLMELTYRAYMYDVGQDVPIWEHKRYEGQPALAKGDGPIGRYRAWAGQFYSPVDVSATESA